jgi:hypothetical protein
MDVEQLRGEAKKLLDEHGVSMYALRSCWNCNPAHEHLKQAEYVLRCIGCGHVFFRGEDITEGIAK